MALTMVHYAPVVTKLRCVLSRQLQLAVYLPSCATFGFLPWWLTGPNYSLSNTQQAHAYALPELDLPPGFRRPLE